MLGIVSIIYGEHLTNQTSLDNEDSVVEAE